MVPQEPGWGEEKRAVRRDVEDDGGARRTNCDGEAEGARLDRGAVELGLRPELRLECAGAGLLSPPPGPRQGVQPRTGSHAAQLRSTLGQWRWPHGATLEHPACAMAPMVGPWPWHITHNGPVWVGSKSNWAIVLILYVFLREKGFLALFCNENRLARGRKSWAGDCWRLSV